MSVVKLGGEDVTRTKLMTYLGVKFDRIEHVDHVVTKTRKGLSAMKVGQLPIFRRGY